MDFVEILIDGQQADYEKSESLPISFRLVTDEYFKVVGISGAKLDNPAKRLILPGTQRNVQIFKGLSGLAEAVIKLNGSIIFSGSGSHKSTERSGQRIMGYSMALFGGAKDLFDSLGSKTLRGLDLGTTTFNNASIEASWGGSYDAGDPVVWAPVLYGWTGSADNNMTDGYMRPSVYFAHIMAGIAKELRISINSTFFGTNFFKRFVYLFGVGNMWDVGGVSASNLLAKSDAPQAISGTEKIAFPNEGPTPPYEDTGNIWVSDTGTAVAGTWSFSCLIPEAENVSLEFVIAGVLTVAFNVEDLLEIGPINIGATTTFYVQATQLDPLEAATVGANAFIKAKRVEGPGLGAEVSVASCLHAKPIKSFLEGMSHLFNLVWHYDPARRTLKVEPRYGYEIDGTHYEGFYKRVAAPRDWSGRVDGESISDMPAPRDFGDYLTLNNQPEESPYYEKAAAAGNTEGIPFLGARYDFDPTGRDGEASVNPFFENVLINDNTGVGGNVEYLITILPEPEDGQTQIPDPTYESGPKYAYYAGELAFGWKFNGALQTTRPELIFKPRPISLPGQYVCVAFSDYVAETGDQFESGLARRFYPRWLTSINRSRVIEAPLYLRSSDAYPNPETFQEAGLMLLDGNEIPVLLIEASRFEPLRLESTKGLFVEVVEMTTSDLARLKSNYQRHFTSFYP